MKAQIGFAFAILASSLLAPAFLHADCPDGSRTLSATEQQAYVALQTSIKAALPAAPAGWVLKDPAAKMTLAAPSSTCKGLDAVAGYYVIYFSEEQARKNADRSREQDTRVREASKFTPEEQKALDDFDRPSRDLARQSVQAIRDKKPEEAARLRAQSDELHQKSNAVRAAHNARILRAVTAILNEYTNSYVSPEVAVNIVVNDNERSAAGKEKLQISGVPLAFADGKEITMSFGKVAPAKASGGLGTKPRTIWVTVTGDRASSQTIANLFGNSSLTTLAKK